MRYKKYIEVDRKAPIYSKRIAGLLNEKGMTQSDLASQCKCVSEASLTAWIQGDKHGRYTEPKVQGLTEVAKVLGVSLDYLMGQTEVKEVNLQLQKICEYTKLTQKAVDNLSNQPDKLTHVTTQTLESEEFWEIMRIMSYAQTATDFLDPNPDFIINSIGQMFEKDGIPETYRRALSLIGANGMGAAYKQRIGEYINKLFDKVVKNTDGNSTET